MKLSIERNTLLKAVSHAQSVVERRNTIPILANVLIEAEDDKVQFRATDLDVEIVDRVKAKVDRTGSTTVSAVLLHEIARKLPDGALIELTADTASSRLTVEAGRSNFSLATLPKEDFPIMASSEYAANFSAKSGDLRRLFDKSRFAISTEETRYYLNGVYMHSATFENSKVLRCVATDGHRLAYSSSACELPSSGKTCIVPRKCINELKRILSSFNEINGVLTEVDVSSKNIQFNIHGYKLLSKLVEGNYPDYNKVFPKSLPNNLKVDRLLLKSALQRLSILSTEQFKGVKFKLSNSLLNLSTINSQQESGDESIECDYGGDELEIGFNLSYLLETLDVISTQQIAIHLGGSDSGCLVTADGDESSKYIIMPMRV